MFVGDGTLSVEPCIGDGTLCRFGVTERWYRLTRRAQALKETTGSHGQSIIGARIRVRVARGAYFHTHMHARQGFGHAV